MKINIFLKFAIPVLGALAVSACVVESTGGGNVGGGPIVAPAPIFEYKWVGTAPFCAATTSSCSKLGTGWEYSGKSSTSGNGSTCVSGFKVECRRQTN